MLKQIKIIKPIFSFINYIKNKSKLKLKKKIKKYLKNEKPHLHKVDNLKQRLQPFTVLFFQRDLGLFY